jgi:hypothetical protein
MKTRNFYVPVESIIEFAEIIEENDLKGVILGGDEKEEELTISVEFEEEDSAAILEMIEYIESINEDDDD